ncbi:hypothetical protein Hanom_Chr02g00119901 [Helianthus anomalus]
MTNVVSREVQCLSTLDKEKEAQAVETQKSQAKALVRIADHFGQSKVRSELYYVIIVTLV